MPLTQDRDGELHPYAVFLRGINLGRRRVKMDQLRAAFEDLGFVGVKTVLASGNVRFETAQTSPKLLTERIEEHLAKVFGFETNVLIRTMEELRCLVEANPFEGVAVTPQTRFYVTFLSSAPRPEFNAPHESPDKSFRIVQVTPRHVCSVLTLSDTAGTLDLMEVLDREYGADITTRTWNTVTRLVDTKR